MSAPTQSDTFTEVINSLMTELHTLPHSTKLILCLLEANIDSPVLAEIQHLSLDKLDADQLFILVLSLKKMVNLTSLALQRCRASPDCFKSLFTTCSTLPKLQSLDLSHSFYLDSDALHFLSQSTTLSNLVSLNLHSCRDIITRVATQTPDLGGLLALLSSPLVKNLTHFGLGWTGIPTEVLIAIATSPHLSNLVSLDLSQNTFTPDAVSALAASTTLGNLTGLNLLRTSLDDELIAQLLSPPSLLGAKLQSIDLSDCAITVSSLEVVFKACPNLTELILAWNNQLGPDGVSFIATHMPNLTKLSLSHCNIGDEGYAALAASTALSNLRELKLSENEARAESIIALINSPVMANLVHLDLAFIDSGPEVLTAVAQSPSMSNLQHLDFHLNTPGPKGILALARSTTLTNLTWLDLTNYASRDPPENRVGSKEVELLCTSPVVSKLTYLSLGSHACIGNSIAAILAAPSSTLHSLVELKLGNIRMTDPGVAQLLVTPNLDQLNVLILEDNTATKQTKRVYEARFDTPF